MRSSLRIRVTNVQLSRVELSLVFLLFLFGIPMILLIPPGAGYDEEDHLVRVWELSAFSFIPGQLSPQEMKYPTVFRDFAYRQQGSTGTIGANFWQKYARASLYEHGFVHREINTKSVYSPVLLFPQAILMRFLGRDLDLPALLVFYACRFASLLSYFFLVWLALRLLPFGKWILLVLALSPMALFQATTISPDAISNGIGFLFIAGCLSAAESKEIRWKEVGYLVVLIFLLFLAKLNLIPLILLPFLLISPARFTNKRIYLFLLAATFILFLMEAAGWNIIASRQSNSLLSNDANVREQLSYILGHPLTFFLTVIKDLVVNGWNYFTGWIDGYGYYYWTPPLIVSIFFVLTLSSVLLMNSTHGQVGRNFQIVFIFMFVLGYLATVGAEYMTFTPVGSNQILGVQGRYFVPLALLLFLALASLSWAKKISPPSFKWIVSFLAAALFLNILGIFFAFHVACGTTFYQTGLCYRPLYRDFPSDTHTSPPISSEISLRQEFHVTCNGLSELRLLITPSTARDRGMTRFTLEEASANQTVLDRSIANNQISTNDWYPLRFDPDWQSAGKQYILNIFSTNTTSDGLRLLYTTQPEFNLGDLYQNGQLLNEDIVLQYGCVAGLRKIWLTGKS